MRKVFSAERSWPIWEPTSSRLKSPGGPGTTDRTLLRRRERSRKEPALVAYNLNKRGITLDIETAKGKALFERLARTSDFVIESYPPGFMDKVGLGYSALSKLHPRIILTSITPFGHTGPYRDYKSSDLVGMAMGDLPISQETRVRLLSGSVFLNPTCWPRPRLPQPQ